jgi:cephalosporin hydroxylase
VRSYREIPSRLVAVMGKRSVEEMAIRPKAFAKKFLRSVRLPHQADVIEKFNYLYYHGTAGQPIFSNMQWFGVNILKCPTDLFIYQEILNRTQPEVIVECGVRHGGSSLYLAHLCDIIGKGRIIGCDITLKDVAAKTRNHPRVTLHEGSSTAPAIVEKISAECAGKRTMVILDSDHSEKHVTAELAAYSPLVTKGCYLVVEDTNVNGHPAHRDHGPGPYEAVQKFLKNQSGFKVDTDCERLLLTFNPSGYLLKV